MEELRIKRQCWEALKRLPQESQNRVLVAILAKAFDDCEPNLDAIEMAVFSLYKRSNKAFVKPTLAEVEEYCRTRNNGVDARKWYAHYEAVGWKIGKVKMVDWQAAVRTWEKNNTQSGQSNAWMERYLK